MFESIAERKFKPESKRRPEVEDQPETGRGRMDLLNERRRSSGEVKEKGFFQAFQKRFFKQNLRGYDKEFPNDVSPDRSGLGNNRGGDVIDNSGGMYSPQQYPRAGKRAASLPDLALAHPRFFPATDGNVLEKVAENDGIGGQQEEDSPLPRAPYSAGPGRKNFVGRGETNVQLAAKPSFLMKKMSVDLRGATPADKELVEERIRGLIGGTDGRSRLGGAIKLPKIKRMSISVEETVSLFNSTTSVLVHILDLLADISAGI